MTGLRASTNNRSSTVLSVFLEAVGKYGMPSRMRGDRGAENKAVSIYMILKNGLNRGSFVWGSCVSTSIISQLSPSLTCICYSIDQLTIPGSNGFG